MLMKSTSVLLLRVNYDIINDNRHYSKAETGSAAAMTSSAICELMGADPETCLHAAAISLKNVMGQVCDPVA